MNALRTLLLLTAGALLAGCASPRLPSVHEPVGSAVDRPRFEEARVSDSSPPSRSSASPHAERTRFRHIVSATRRAPLDVTN